MLINRWRVAVLKKDIMTISSCFTEDATYFDPLFGHISRSMIPYLWTYIAESRTQLKWDVHDLKYLGDGYWTFRNECSWTFNSNSNMQQKMTCHIQVRDGYFCGMSMAFSMHEYCSKRYGLVAKILGWNRLYQYRIRLNELRLLTAHFKINQP